MSETKAKTTETYDIDCKFEIHVTFKVVASSLDDAIAQIDRPLLKEYGLSDTTFGFDADSLEEQGIEIESVEADEGPSPTGREYTRRDWQYTVTEEDE